MRETPEKMVAPLIPGEDYYMEDGLMVMTAAYHEKRGSCCGSGCRWCPYKPKHLCGATTLAKESKDTEGTCTFKDNAS
jgi:Family of unknown function (DUF5522)